MATTNAIHLTVVTPERRVLDQTTDSVVITAHDGELGVLQGRSPLMCELGVGRLRYTDGGREQTLFVDGGFAQVFDDNVIVLTERAVAAGEITPELIGEAERDVAAGQTAEDRRKASDRLRVMQTLANR